MDSGIDIWLDTYNPFLLFSLLDYYLPTNKIHIKKIKGKKVKRGKNRIRALFK